MNREQQVALGKSVREHLDFLISEVGQTPEFWEEFATEMKR